MSLGISAKSLQEAYKDSQEYRFIEEADREFRIVKDDGMTLKIPQDNLLDFLINTFDHRRLELEKKSEILHDYYGDRLLAKDLFQDYLSHKKWYSGTANLLSLGVLGLNAYSRVMSNSVFMKKFGTISTILALQFAGRHFSNNWLESRIERPWKIHAYRMSKGLGPTNVPSNHHPEIITTSLRFLRLSVSSRDLLYGTFRKFVPNNPNIKIPLDKEHYPYALDEEDMPRLTTVEQTTYKRHEKAEPEDFGDAIRIPSKYFQWYYITRIKALNEPTIFPGFFKNMMNGHSTIYRPDHSIKELAFEANSPDQLYKDKIIEKNEYFIDPYGADIHSDLPLYAQKFTNEINVTEEKMELLKHHWIQRLKFKKIKKEIAEEFERTKDADDVKQKFAEFYEQMKKEDLQYLLKNVQVAAPDREKNALDNNKFLILFDSDKKALEQYYDTIIRTRPQMIKETKSEFEYDDDFEVDLNNYDPWQEYKLIYKDLFKNGRAYYIIKSIPEWRFLQIGEPSSEEDNINNEINPKRYNSRDSIFTILSIDRYFQERRTKEGLYKARSQAIRI